MAVPLWKSVKNGLTRKAELGVEVARAGTLWPWSPHGSRMGYLSCLISCLLLRQITKKYYFSMLSFAVIAILTFSTAAHVSKPFMESIWVFCHFQVAVASHPINIFFIAPPLVPCKFSGVT